MKYLIISLGMLLIGMQSKAQQKLLTIEDAVLKQRTTLAPERLSQLQWIPGTNTFSYVGKLNGVELVITQDAASLKRDTVLTLADFNTAYQNLKPEEKRMNRFPFITWVNKSSLRFMYNNAVYLFTFNDMRIRLLASAPKGAEDIDYDPVSNKLAYTYAHNLFVNKEPGAYEAGNTNNGDEVNKKDLITADGSTYQYYGKAVHRNEFGINKGTFFSPKGNKIAFYQLNEVMVSDYELMNIENPDTLASKLAKPTGFNKLKYPMAGNTSHQAKVMLYNFNKKQLLQVKTEGDAEQYLTNIGWSPDEEYLYIAIVNRAQNEMKLNLYDGNTGAFIKTLFTETHPKYVEPEKPVYFINNDATKFIWQSEREGLNQLYYYNSRGVLIKKLNTGSGIVSDIICADPSGNFLFCHVYTPDGLSKQVYRIDIKNNTYTIINKLDGQHAGLVSTDGKYILETIEVSISQDVLC